METPKRREAIVSDKGRGEMVLVWPAPDVTQVAGRSPAVPRFVKKDEAPPVCLCCGRRHATQPHQGEWWSWDD